MIAEVIIESNVKTLNRHFDYNIPKEMENNISIGSRVLIPFGRSKKLEEGFVTNIKESTEYEVKDIAKIEKQSLTTEKIILAKWMAKRYFSNVAECMKLMLKPGTTTKNFANRAKDKTALFASLVMSNEQTLDYINNNKIKSEKQQRILMYLIKNGQTLQSELIEKTEASRAIVKTLEKNGFLKLQEQKVVRNPLLNKNITRTKNLQFTTEQQLAYSKIADSIERKEFKKYLLYGVTGSGKTEIYLQLIEKIVEQGKSAIMLVPEISLTPQMINRFIERFGKEIIKSMEMIMGKQDNIYFLGLYPEDDPMVFSVKVKEKIIELSQNGEVLVMVDVFGGTPSNASASNMRELKFECVTGVSLPMLIEVVLNKTKSTLDELIKIAIMAGTNSVIDLRKAIFCREN